MVTLQNIIAPEQAIDTAPALYYRGTGSVEALSGQAVSGQAVSGQGRYRLSAGGKIAFDTYFNLFNLGTWTKTCALTGLCLDVTVTGPCEIRVHHQSPTGSRTLIHRSRQSLTRATPFRIDLTAQLARSEADVGLLSLEIRARGVAVTLHGARFACSNRLRPPLRDGQQDGLQDHRRDILAHIMGQQPALRPGLKPAPPADLKVGTSSAPPPRQMPRLVVSITTYKRAPKVRDTVARLERFLAGFAFGDQIHVQVIDNGHSSGHGAKITNNAHVSSYSNPNFGGAGGFARGLLEAQDRGASHCLFMDDDASFHMENILRCYMLLALARDPKTALAGAMISTLTPWEMWENGAYFDGACHPLFHGTDLRQPKAVRQMEQAGPQTRPSTFYGGWWFFAFPLDQLRHHPFPFFVRGDDISFSLANDFTCVTLNGVVSFQDDFVEKETAQTLYLDLRNHLLHHLIFDQLARSPLGTAQIACRFMMRSMLRCKYESAAAQLLAWQDVMQGPEFFDRNLDMQARSATIRSLTRDERWQDLPPSPPLSPPTSQPHNQPTWQRPERRCFSRLPRRLRHYFGLLSLNGHLLPFWSRFGDRLQLGISESGLVFPAFGAARLTYLNRAQTQCYTLRHSKRRFFALAWQMAKTLLRWHYRHGALKQAYRRGYDEMTTRAYWEEKLQRPAPPAAPPAPAAAPADPSAGTLSLSGFEATAPPPPGPHPGSWPPSKRPAQPAP